MGYLNGKKYSCRREVVILLKTITEGLGVLYLTPGYESEIVRDNNSGD